MADFKTHCNDCKIALGKDYAVVHRWLDALWPKLGPKHRSARHHDVGVEQVRQMWGDEAAKAAEIHIRKDFLGHLPTVQESQEWTIYGQIVVPKKDGEGGLSDAKG